MARKVAQELRYCNNCGRDTLHLKNTKEMSWLMHIGLTIITFGLWLFFWIATTLFHGLTKPIGGAWTCSVCGGTKQGATPAKKGFSKKFWVYLGVLTFIGILLPKLLPERVSGGSSASTQSDDTNFCYAQGTALARNYMANVVGLASQNIFASDVMRQGCEKNAGSRGTECVKLCEDSFKHEAKSILNK